MWVTWCWGSTKKCDDSCSMNVEWKGWYPIWNKDHCVDGGGGGWGGWRDGQGAESKHMHVCLLEPVTSNRV